GSHACQHVEFLAVHEMQEANRVATASHGELSRLLSRDGIKQQKAEDKGEDKLEGSKDPWEPRVWDKKVIP
ncbi:hypothetical protein AVEN_199485-1, partial [Araneus ventricosus]